MNDDNILVWDKAREPLLTLFGLVDIFKLSPAYLVVPRAHDHCPPGSSQIKNQEECRQVALNVFLGPNVGIHQADFSIKFPTSQSYCGVNRQGQVQFNRYPNGRRAGFVRSVCKRQKTIVPVVVPPPVPAPTIKGFSMIYNGMIHNPQPWPFCNIIKEGPPNCR